MVSAADVWGEVCGVFTPVAPFSGHGGWFPEDACLAGGLGLDCRGAPRRWCQAMAGFGRVLAVILK